MNDVLMREASTALLLRDGDDAFEVLLLRRNSRSSFMPDAYVYPGGVLEEADADVVGELLATDVSGDTVPDMRRFYVAALRECFEESNLLVATRGALPEGPVRSEWREKLLANSVYMPEFLRALDLSLDLAALVRFDHWVTPAFEPKRFDTHFFLARVSEVSHAQQDGREVVDATWLRPADALERHARGELRLFPPTWATLSWLTQFEHAEDAMAAARRRTITPIEPHFDSVDGQVVAYFPGHPQHPADETAGPGGTLWLFEGSWSYRRDRSEYRWSKREA